jgi:biopolymer transport protein ExbD
VKLRELRVQQQPRLMIIPMIDIMFFLLVFFIMSTLYMVEQRTIPVNLPQTASAKHDLQKQIAVAITADGKVFFDQEEIPRDLVAKRVQAELNRQQDISFVLRADKRVGYGEVVAVLDELKSLGVRRVAIATEAKSR